MEKEAGESYQVGSDASFLPFLLVGCPSSTYLLACFASGRALRQEGMCINVVRYPRLPYSIQAFMGLL